MNQYLIKFIRDIKFFNPNFVICVLLISISCSEKNVDKKENNLSIIEEFNMVFPHLKLDNSWKPNIQSKPNEEYFLQLEKEDSVALFNNIWLQKNIIQSEGINGKISEVCYSVPTIFYYWFDGKTGKMIEYNDQLDTLWEYIHFEEITDLNQEIFIKGKYLYMYRNHLLTERQKKYYEIHKDSLKNVKGNDLPNLPEIVD
jgi:hypothetical protein